MELKGGATFRAEVVKGLTEGTGGLGSSKIIEKDKMGGTEKRVGRGHKD